MAGRPEEAIYRFLDTNGDGSGTQNAVGDYSGAAEEFYYQPPRNTELHRMVIHITDTAGISQAEYGNLGSALTNGYSLVVKDESGAQVNDLCDGIPIKSNADFGRYCYDVELKSWTNTPANETVQVRWTFAKAGFPLYLPANYQLSITFNDNLSGLIEHYFMLQGYETTT